MSLPPLPKYTHASHEYEQLHTKAAMQAYGQACREQALEEAALFIENGSFMHDQSPAKLFAAQLAPKIRSLK